MATQFFPDWDILTRDVLTARPHAVALPYRGDGVARALREAYASDDDYSPPDMLRLLMMIDEPLRVTDPG